MRDKFGLIIDCFAGGGGASVGIEMALGRKVDIAINHDPEAIRMHTVNHPSTIHLTEDIFKVDLTKYVGDKPVALMWASPDCTSYSIAAISHHRERERDGNLAPVSDYAKFCDKVNQHVLCLILALSPKYWFIENPRGGLRKMNFMNGLPRYTVTYCQYGDKRMKPTDIWTNHPDPQFKPPCHNGDPCHESAPRGSRTGTQGLTNSKERSIIPQQLCEHIVTICEQ